MLAQQAESVRPPASQSAASGHLAFLDGVRGFACLYVMMHHGVLDLRPSSSPVYATLLAFFYEGRYAVDAFIVLSGYCLMLPLAAKHEPVALWPFIRRRALRIIPTYYLAMGFSLLMIATLVGERTGSNWDNALPVGARDLVLHLLLIHEWSTRSMFHINTAFWSIGVEWKIYFLFPLLIALRNRLGAATMAVLALVSGYAVWLGLRRFNLFNPGAYGCSPYYMSLFALGMWSADLGTKRLSQQGALALHVSFGALSLALLGLTIVQHDEHARLLSVQVMSAVVGLWVALGLALVRDGAFPAARGLFSWQPAVQFGKMGFTIYLVHAPIAQFVAQYLIDPAPWSDNTRALLMPPVYLACTLAVAVPFYYLFERPFHSLSRRRASSAHVDPRAAPARAALDATREA